MPGTQTAVLIVLSSLALQSPSGGDGATGAASPPPAGSTTQSEVEPQEGQAIRVGGDMDAQAELAPDGSFRFGRCLIDTPLPEGYPAPTPPGAIEIKRYPLVRRAQVTGTSTPDLGSNIAFFPLFNHIKSRDIAMTSPVEMDFKPEDKEPPEGGDVRPAQWTMSFLYRKPEQGPLGNDKDRTSVTVVDAPPVTVISLGVQGPYGYQRMRKEWRKLEKWLSEQTTFEAAGSPRALYYNGPDRRNADKWAEVQIPIVRRAAKPESESSVPAPQAQSPASTARP